MPSSNIENSQNIYTVKSGDSLWSIANRYNTTVNELKQINNLTSNNLSIGQVLRLPSSNIENSQNTYTVKSGDSLWNIANRYGITVDELKRYNNLLSDNLAIGQTLKLPSKDNKNTYTVKSGDSLWNIANRYGITVDKLKRYNNLSSNSLSIGQKIVIPQ